MHSQTLGDGQDDLPMRDRGADLLGNAHGGQQGPLLVARGTRAALLAGKGHKHFVLAVGTTNSGEAFFQIAALKEGPHRLFDDRSPIAILGLIALVVDLLKGVKVLVEQTPQVAGPGIAWAVERQGPLKLRFWYSNCGISPVFGSVRSQMKAEMHTFLRMSKYLRRNTFGCNDVPKAQLQRQGPGTGGGHGTKG
jgi:hypothetical protein